MGRSDVADSTLVHSARNGDEAAFTALYRRHIGAVRLAVGDHVSDSASREDLAQETFIRALAAIDQLHDAERFRPWLLQIARNAAIDERRRRRAIAVSSIDDEAAPELVSPDPSPVELSELRDMARNVRSGLARMSKRDALVLSLSVQFGFGPREIAEALGITTNNAKVVLHRARRRLRLAVELAEHGQNTAGSRRSAEPTELGQPGQVSVTAAEALDSQVLVPNRALEVSLDSGGRPG